MDLKIDLRRVESLVPYARNSRTHSDEQIAQIMASMVEFGFTNPVLADEHGIVAGHGRVISASRIYASGGTIKLPSGGELPRGTVPVIDVSGWSEAQRRAYIIADNKLAENAGWDMGLLKIEVGDLQGMDFDLTLLGFDEKVLAEMLVPDPEPGQTNPDQTPEPPQEPTTVRGDVWLLGGHRIICGDSTEADTVAKLLGPVRPHLMVTDPPYGVEYDAGWRGEAKNSDGSRLSTGKGRAKGKVQNDHLADWREAWALFPGDVAYVWHADKTAYEVETGLREAGFERRSMVIWKKKNFVVGRGHYHPQHECCFYLVRKGSTGHWNGDRKQATVWDIEHRKSETGHSTQKPVEAMRRPIENNSSPGQAVYEPFSGSGTTIIAGEMTARSVYAVEINPAYVDVAVIRWQDFTGKEATLEGDGRTFAEIAKERSGHVE